MADKKKLDAVTKAIRAYARMKGSQSHIVSKITNWNALGRTHVGLHAITPASAAMLLKVGFKVLMGPDKPPESIKHIVNWKHLKT